MIVSISRRTDVPAFYSDWFFNRVRDGYALTRNPLNAKQVRRVSLAPEDVDGLVFWSKNPLPMIPRLDELGAFPYYFQYTLNPYAENVEPCLPALNARVETLKRLSDAISPQRIVWRYDPILISPRASMGWHIDQFESLCLGLKGRVERVVISFLDMYAKIGKRLSERSIEPPHAEVQRAIAIEFVRVARSNGLTIQACCEPAIMDIEGIGQAHCVDAELLSRVAGRPIPTEKEKHQRPGCACANSVDIGAYDSCAHGCAYCYANRGDGYVQLRMRTHDPSSPFLIGGIE